MSKPVTDVHTNEWSCIKSNMIVIHSDSSTGAFCRWHQCMKYTAWKDSDRFVWCRYSKHQSIFIKIKRKKPSRINENTTTGMKGYDPFLDTCANATLIQHEIFYLDPPRLWLFGGWLFLSFQLICLFYFVIPKLISCLSVPTTMTLLLNLLWNPWGMFSLESLVYVTHIT